MAFELDPCAVHTATGELVARGFVREHTGDAVVVETQHESGTWLGEGEGAVLELFSATRGALTYDGVVEFAAGRRVGLRDLRLREVVQQRSAVRVQVSVPVTVHPVGEDEEREPVEAVVIDLSAHGLRFRSDGVFTVGDQVQVLLPLERGPIPLTLEVVRSEDLRGGVAYGCQIVGTSERVQDALFRHVLDQQRAQLARRAEQR